MILTGKEIKELKIINPCDDKKEGLLSYGLEPAGYTLRLSNKWKYIPLKKYGILDPMKKREANKMFKEIEADFFVIRPKAYVLAMSFEYIDLPNDISAVAFTKSTYARLGVFANITTIDAGWHGYLTVEIANLGQVPVKVYAYKGIAELVFMKHKETEGYKGNYQDLKEVKI